MTPEFIVIALLVLGNIGLLIWIVFLDGRIEELEGYIKRIEK